MSKPDSFRCLEDAPLEVWRFDADSGFSLAELLISTLILLIIAGTIFAILGETQHSVGYGAETQAVNDHVRAAVDAVDRIIRQAGNDPRNAGFEALSNLSPTSVTVKSDLTGSAAASGFPDKGDPDGDVSDANENITIRYNSSAKTLDIVPDGGSAQAVAGYVSGFSLEYFDVGGAPTSNGTRVRKVRVTMEYSGGVPDPRTGQIFRNYVTSDIHLAAVRWYN